MTSAFPFFIVRLTFHGGEFVTAPLTDATALHINKKVEALTQKFTERFQEKVLDQGNYERILSEIKRGSFTQSKVKVDFPAAKDGVSYPGFSLEFDVFFQVVKHGVWGVLPALGLECMAEDEANFPARMAEMVKVEFTSKKRLQATQTILEAMWFESATIEKTTLELRFHSPADLKGLQQKNEQNLLPKIGKALRVEQPEAFGRETEIGLMQRILKGRFAKNILLVGASGSGKTTLVRELAFRQNQDEKAMPIWETSASRLIKELTGDTGWQDSLSLLVKELTVSGNILFVKNLAELFEVGRYEGNEVSMADYLRPSLSRGELILISECTPEERARIDLLNPGYLTFFQTVDLHTPQSGLEDIIRKKVLSLAGQNKVEFQLGSIEEVIRLHQRFMPYSGMPGKPIRFLEAVLLTNKKIRKKKKKKSEPVDANESPSSVVSRDAVLRHFSEDSGMPLFLIDPAMPMDVKAIQRKFNKNVFGQESAVEAVTGLLASVKTALTRTGKPLASFLFVGPTGVGKTELAKVLADFTFGSRERTVRFDMSEYSDPYSVMRLTGQHFNTDGLLTSAVRREPFCVLLFDEIEKADPSFFDLLLQILGEGRLSDSRGQLVNFCSAIIVMTSNIGAGNLQQNRIGWKKELGTDDVKAHFEREVEKHFKPELFNRIDSVVTFKPLSKEMVRYVVERELKLFKLREGIQFRRIDLQIEEEVLDFLAEQGYDPKYGARYLQRTLRELLIVPLARQLNQYEHDDRLAVKVLLEDNRITTQVESDPMAFDLLMEQWDKLTLAEETSRLRRKMVMMLEGPIYMRLQSELDLLEIEKTRLQERFWEDVSASGQYTHFLSAKELADKLFQDIQNLEMEIALASMDQTEFQGGFQDRLEQWGRALEAWQLQVHSLLYPAENNCLLGIYGGHPETIAQFYLGLIEQKQYIVKLVHAIWVTEDLRNGKSGFHKQTVSQVQLERFDFQPEDPNALLYGFEMQLYGDAIQKYLAWELGIQRWEGKEKGQWQPYLLMYHKTAFDTPENIHRQNFYKSPKPHRIWSERELVDHRLGINGHVKLSERLKLLTERLDQRFLAVLDQFFLGGDGS